MANVTTIFARNMNFSSAEALLKDVKKGDVLPVYLLYGEEPYFIDVLTKYFEANLLTEAESAFNMSVLYGRDVDAKQILDHARQFPMMATRRVVILKEAQAMRDLKALESYIQSPSPQTVFVIAHKKKIDGRIKWVKSAKTSDKVGCFQSDPVPEYKLNEWINGYVRSQKLQIAPEGIEMLSHNLGSDLKKISNEIEKLRLNIEGNSIDVSDIEKLIGVSRDYDVYALLKSISNGDTVKVHQITDNLESNKKDQPLQRILPAMATYFEKVLVVAQHFKKDDRALSSMIGTFPGFVKEYRNTARRYGYSGLYRIYHKLVKADAMSKGMDRRNQDGILKELIGEILLLQRST